MVELTQQDAGTSEGSESEGSGSGRGRLILRIVGGMAILVALWFLARQAGDLVPVFVERVESLGFWAPLAFVVGYAVATVAFIPGSLLTLAGGALFGIVQGTVLVFIGATLGATGAFLVARYVARRAIAHKVAESPRFEAIDRAVAREGRKIVFLLRLSPVFPFVFLNYALGLTRVRLVDYVVASVGMLPATVLYVYYGKLAGDVAALAGGAAPERGWQYYAVLGLGVLATLAVTTVVTRMAQRALGELAAEPDDGDPDEPDLDGSSEQPAEVS